MSEAEGFQTIEVRLPEGPVCEVRGGLGATCILPLANVAGWHELFGGHLARVLLAGGDGEGDLGYVTWREGDGSEEGQWPILHPRPDLVDPAEEE